MQRQFFGAVEVSDVGLAEKLLTFDPYLVYSTDIYGSSALNIAARNGSLDIVRLLISKGANVNHDSRYAMPLHSAAYSGRADIADALLNAGADLNCECHWSEISIAGTPLHQAAAGGSLEVVRLLLDRGANANSRESQYNQTPLHFAVQVVPERNARADVIELLIAHGADVNAKDSLGNSALAYVKRIPEIYDTKNMLRVLESHGAK